ncbi:MAG: lyase family protein, partial [Gaiellaceae bacterium]|nr:lyase family protein [Gaiellaceae bacterium]
VLKMGRTQLQDAVPMTLGQEFSTYAVMLAEDEERLREGEDDGEDDDGDDEPDGPEAHAVEEGGRDEQGDRVRRERDRDPDEEPHHGGTVSHRRGSA